MAESVLADHDGTRAKKVMKVKAKRKSGSASITPSSRDPESSPERAPVVDAPPPLDPTHSYMEDCVAIMKHAIDTAAGRMAFPAARREKVVIELVNIGMHFGLEGLDGVTLARCDLQSMVCDEEPHLGSHPLFPQLSNRSWTSLDS